MGRGRTFEERRIFEGGIRSFGYLIEDDSHIIIIWGKFL
jgi:hypothetical protein